MIFGYRKVVCFCAPFWWMVLKSSCFKLATFVVFRQIYLYFMSGICNEIIPIAMSYPAGWLLCSTITAVYYHKVNLSKTRIVE